MHTAMRTMARSQAIRTASCSALLTELTGPPPSCEPRMSARCIG